jgi:serine phosphatase RsbU (regulator of sigma subunit)
LSRARVWLGRFVAPESARGKQIAVVALLGLTALCLILNDAVGPAAFPVFTLVVPLVFGGLLLSPRPLLVLIVAAFAVLIAENAGIGKNVVHPGAYVVMAIVSGIALQQSLDRERLGLSIGRGEQMLIELRDRLRLQGALPALPADWHAEMEQRSAGGASFGGDFIVASRSEDGATMELALVDVSGKGLDAGSRALMLSGALGGLLGAVPAEDFLAAANDYLLRQSWDEGFATAMHLQVDLGSGRYRLSNAGHPPAVHYQGGTGRWELVAPQGTVLGLLQDAEFGAVEGELRAHDAVLLYTDGLVEVPGRDLAVGIDKLLGAAERLIPHGFEGGALQLLKEVTTTANDDRALLLLWRT